MLWLTEQRFVWYVSKTYFGQLPRYKNNANRIFFLFLLVLFWRIVARKKQMPQEPNYSRTKYLKKSHFRAKLLNIDGVLSHTTNARVISRATVACTRARVVIKKLLRSSSQTATKKLGLQESDEAFIQGAFRSTLSAVRLLRKSL